jgi:hypothetical protein
MHTELYFYRATKTATRREPPLKFLDLHITSERFYYSTSSYVKRHHIKINVHATNRDQQIKYQ